MTSTKVEHVSYPHEPGRLYGCPACESRCHCTPGHAECVYDGEHDALRLAQWDAAHATPYPDGKPCTCGIPNRANWHTHVVLGRDVAGGTETTDTDIYSCGEHLSDDPRDMLRWDGHEQWDVIESRTTHLR